MTSLTIISAAAASALVSAVWQGAILALCVALVLRLLPGISAALRSLVWTAVFAIVLALHFLAPMHAASGSTAHPIHVAAIWSIALAALWLALSLFRATEFARSALSLRQIARRATPVDLSAPFIAPLSHALRGSTHHQTLRSYILCTSNDVDRPSVLGFFSPRILLPSGLLESLTPAELRQVLLHETEHLRRSDDWTNLLQKVALALFPLNPVLFWVERRLCLERELACDDRVLAASITRKSYATCLTRIAEHGILHRGIALALGAFGHRSELATRVHRILRRPVRTMSRPAATLATATLLAGVTVGSITLAHSPRLITFAPTAMVESADSTPVQTGSHDVISHSTFAARPMLVKAALPARPADQPIRIQHHRRSVVQSAPRVLQTRFSPAPHINPTSQPHLTLTVSSDTQVQPLLIPAFAQYAALRTPDGWIIFQL